QRGRGGGELGARVDALRLDRVGRDVNGDAVACLDEVAEDVRQVQLALRVVRRQALQGRPEEDAAEDVDGGVRLPDRQLVRRSVRRLDDRAQSTVVAPHDAA